MFYVMHHITCFVRIMYYYFLCNLTSIYMYVNFILVIVFLPVIVKDSDYAVNVTNIAARVSFAWFEREANQNLIFFIVGWK